MIINSYSRDGALVHMKVVHIVDYYMPASQCDLPTGIMWNVYELSEERQMQYGYYIVSDGAAKCAVCSARRGNMLTYYDSHPLTVVTICQSCSTYGKHLTVDHECVATLITDASISFSITSNFCEFAMRLRASTLASVFCRGCKVTRASDGACKCCISYLNSHIRECWLVREVCAMHGLVKDVITRVLMLILFADSLIEQ